MALRREEGTPEIMEVVRHLPSRSFARLVVQILAVGANGNEESTVTTAWASYLVTLDSSKTSLVAETVSVQKPAANLKDQDGVNAVTSSAMLTTTLSYGPSRSWRIRVRRAPPCALRSGQVNSPSASASSMQNGNFSPEQQKVPDACETPKTQDSGDAEFEGPSPSKKRILNGLQKTDASFSQPSGYAIPSITPSGITSRIQHLDIAIRPDAFTFNLKKAAHPNDCRNVSWIVRDHIGVRNYRENALVKVKEVGNK